MKPPSVYHHQQSPSVTPGIDDATNHREEQDAEGKDNQASMVELGLARHATDASHISHYHLPPNFPPPHALRSSTFAQSGCFVPRERSNWDVAMSAVRQNRPLLKPTSGTMVVASVKSRDGLLHAWSTLWNTNLKVG